jgi:hypothetical protein
VFKFNQVPTLGADRSTTRRKKVHTVRGFGLSERKRSGGRRKSGGLISSKKVTESSSILDRAQFFFFLIYGIHAHTLFFGRRIRMYSTPQDRWHPDDSKSARKSRVFCALQPRRGKRFRLGDQFSAQKTGVYIPSRWRWRNLGVLWSLGTSKRHFCARSARSRPASEHDLMTLSASLRLKSPFCRSSGTSRRIATNHVLEPNSTLMTWSGDCGSASIASPEEPCGIIHGISSQPPSRWARKIEKFGCSAIHTFASPEEPAAP